MCRGRPPAAPPASLGRFKLEYSGSLLPVLPSHGPPYYELEAKLPGSSASSSWRKWRSRRCPSVADITPGVESNTIFLMLLLSWL